MSGSSGMAGGSSSSSSDEMGESGKVDAMSAMLRSSALVPQCIRPPLTPRPPPAGCKSPIESLAMGPAEEAGGQRRLSWRSTWSMASSTLPPVLVALLTTLSSGDTPLSPAGVKNTVGVGGMLTGARVYQ